LGLSVRTTLAVPAALLLLGIGTSQAADPTLFAETGGFLLGNAHRCGVATERIAQVGEVIHHLINAAAHDSSEAAAADLRFAEIFRVSALADEEQDALIAPCTVVITQFGRLERHYQQDQQARMGRSGFKDVPSSE
jgi:hypothetical protein